MRRKFLFIITLLAIVQASYADGVSASFTVYKQFKPAIIHLVDGRTIRQPLANIFLKNSSLLYVSGNYTKEANMSTIASVEFKDRTYFKIDTLLAYKVDSIGQNALFCATVIDFDAYKTLLINNRQLTDLSLGENFGTTTIDLEDEQDILMPMIDKFYFFMTINTFMFMKGICSVSFQRKKEEF